MPSHSSKKRLSDPNVTAFNIVLTGEPPALSHYQNSEYSLANSCGPRSPSEPSN
jgi:hypothetical protein